jgi:hypothetical protein
VQGDDRTYVPLPVRARTSHTTRVITNVIVHLLGEMPILCDIEAMPEGRDRSIRCTNVRTIDGKRPAFVHDRHSTFILPLSTIRVIEVPVAAGAATGESQAAPESQSASEPEQQVETEASLDDEEPDEDLLARIRSL